ncbi:MAG: peptidase M23 [Chitinophagaceae bacterium]|nr:MAG: peptidase M23 [Chitinophagaceae bacterium]
MIEARDFAVIIQKIAHTFHPVVAFNSVKEKIAALDLSPGNKEFLPEHYESTLSLSRFINNEREKAGAKFLIGGYNETRNMYRRSGLFGSNLSEDASKIEEPRNQHLGIDIWGPEDTRISAPLGGMVHSYAYNNNFADYGATIILQHQVDTLNFYTLYGHLALKDIAHIRTGQFITRGEQFAHFGTPAENGDWPPHLHFQVILDMGNWEGDYPGVCKKSEAIKYLLNSPDPDSILNLRQYL